MSLQELGMFTVEARAGLRQELLLRARVDHRITGAAITGSGALGTEDQWSDVDLAFGVRDQIELPDVLDDWTHHMYQQHAALHHLDVAAGTWLYRVFLLPGTLQADLGFVPAADFRPPAPSFTLVFGDAGEARHSTPRSSVELIGWGSLYALHARSCLARQRRWQAEYMISGMRDTALALACLRHGLPTAHARGADSLPDDAAAQFDGTLVRQLELGELYRAFRVALNALLAEIRSVDPELARRLDDPPASLAAG